MGIEQLFTNSLYLCVTLLALLVFYLSSKYATKEGVVNKAMMYCFWGFFYCFASGYIAFLIPADILYVNSFVFLEMMVMLISLCFFVACATQMLLKTKPDNKVVLLVLLLGTILNAYFLFIEPDGVMIGKIRLLFPLAGFCFLSIAFSAHSAKKEICYFYGALCSIGLSTLYLLEIGGVYKAEFWWLDALVYLFMSMIMVMMRATELGYVVTALKNKIIKKDERLKEIIGHSPFPIIISRLQDDKILVANENAIKLFSIYKSEMERYKLKDFFADQTYRKMLNERLEKNSVVKDFEFLADTKSAYSPFWLLASASVIEYDTDPAIYLAFQDITAIKNKEKMLEKQATKDPLTAIYNRRYFEAEVQKRIKISVEQEKPFAVLMLDADHFKNVNDTYGHKTGDKVLIELASLCEKDLRDKDIVARYGGEEFVMYLADTDEQQAIMVANRLRELAQALVVKSEDGKDVKFTVSVGLCDSSHTTKLSDLVSKADLALYKAKENGRNRVEAYAKDCDKGAKKLSDKKDTHHPIYDQDAVDEISLIDESNKK